jgi:hypothetical protein
MSSSMDCPSRKLGLCPVTNKGIKCYALKAEQQYPNVPKYRERQKHFWKKSSAESIALKMIEKIKNRRKITSYFRYNESGDFENQEDVDKLHKIALILKTINITTYGYSARSDLDFSQPDLGFLIKGSGHDNGNNGRADTFEYNDDIPEGYLECPGGAKG